MVVEEEPIETSGTEADAKVDEINKSSIFADTIDTNDELLEQSDLNEITGTTAAGTSDPWTLEFYTRIGRANGDVKSQCLRYCRWPNETLQHEHGNANDEFAGNGPLWISSDDKAVLDKDIPCCDYCGAERKFEFQIMPQMMHFLKSHTGDETTNVALSQDGKAALLAAADIVNKAKEEGMEQELPNGFQRRQEALVTKWKEKILQDERRDEALDFGTIMIFSCTKSCGGSEETGPYGAYRKEFAWRQKPLG